MNANLTRTRFASLCCDETTMSCTLVLRRHTPKGIAVDCFDLADVGSNEGRGFVLTRKDGQTYHVELLAAGHFCSCEKYAQRGECEHADALAALENAGKI